MSRLLIGGAWVPGSATEVRLDKYSGEPMGEMAVASPEQIEAAVTGAITGFRAARLSPDGRFRILATAASLVTARRDVLISTMTAETGFTRSDGEGEIRRCALTLQLSAEEAKRITGEVVPIDSTPGVRNRMGFTLRVPRGVVCAITPYNSPFNTVAHKLGPGLAAGNAVVLKPSEHTPLCAVHLCELLLEAGLPPQLLALVHGPGATAGRQLLADQRIDYYTFTGSTRVGREIQQAAGLRGTQLELGSISCTIVCGDADIDQALPKIVGASFRKAGQVCTSIQRVLVERRIAGPFIERLIAQTRALKVGDPREPDTVVGPMITLAEAERAAAWIEEAVGEGARILTGGTRDGAILQPTILTDVKAKMRVICAEIFAPVISVTVFDKLQDALDDANSSSYGLAVGLFTSNLRTAFEAAYTLRFGGVHINETSSSRVDLMPYGGVKDSGYGREGPQYAIRDMTEEKLITVAY